MRTTAGLQGIRFCRRLCELLGELDQALTMYSALEGFDEEDLAGTLTSVQAEIEKLPQRYSDLWDLFKEVKNSTTKRPTSCCSAITRQGRSSTSGWPSTARPWRWRCPSRSSSWRRRKRRSPVQGRPETLPESQGSGQAALCRGDRLPRLRAEDQEAA